MPQVYEGNLTPPQGRFALCVARFNGFITDDYKPVYQASLDFLNGRPVYTANFDSVDPNIKPMSQDAFNGGVEYQLKGNATLSVNYTHSDLRQTIEDLGVLENGNEVYKYVNPGEGIAATMVPSGLTAEFATLLRLSRISVEIALRVLNRKCGLS